MITINIIALFLLTITAEIFTCKSFIKPFIPVIGKFLVAKNVNIICMIGAILNIIGSLMFSVYTSLGLEDVSLTLVIFGLMIVGGFVYRFALFKSHTDNIVHSILLCFFGGWMFILGKNTKKTFGSLFHQLWDFEYQPEPISEKVDSPVVIKKEDIKIKEADPLETDDIEENAEYCETNNVEDINLDFSSDEEKSSDTNQPIELEPSDEPFDNEILDTEGAKEINLEEGFDI